MKTCTKCDEEKPLDEFYRDRRSPQGRNSRCKPCVSELGRKRYHRDLEKSRTYRRIYAKTHRRTIRGRAASLINQAKCRARLQGVNCTLNTEWAMARLKQGYCEISRFPFDMSMGHGRWKRQPFTPSIDRLNAGGDYTPENCRVVCWALNMAMSNWGLDPVLKIARALVEEHG